MRAYSALICVILFSAVKCASVCPGGVSIPHCSCQIADSGLAHIKCRPENGTTPASIFDHLSRTGEKLDTIFLTCTEPMELLEPIPKLQCRSLRIVNCGIKRVHEQAFDALAESLEELVLAINKIDVFPFLKRLSRLQVINLSNNSLRDIPERSFDGLENIRQIRVKGNGICVLLPNALNETKSTLELLDLAGNCFTAVPAQNIRNSLNLSHISLANNQITEVSQMQFMNLPKLIELRLNGNRLTRIPPNAFMNVPELRHLNVRNNQLRKFESTTLQAFKKLMLIDLGQNFLVKIPPFKDLPDLVEVNLNDNRIEKVDTLTFSGTPKLRIINLQNNQISTISRNSFDSLDGVNALFLSNNSLKSIERYMFDGLKNLHWLSLANNSLTDLSPTAFISVPNLAGLDLSRNRIEKLRAGTFAKLPKLAFLDLSKNTHLALFEKGCFQSRVNTIFLDGIELNCDDNLDWFIIYLVKNNVRTFVPNQPEIRCATPPQYAGHRLKDLMMTKANDTLASSMQNLGFGQGVGGQVKQNPNFLTRFLPGLTGPNGLKTGSIPILNSITQAMPSLREIPGLNVLTNRQGQPPRDKQLDSAIEQFTEPLVNFATGGSNDVGQLLKTIPNLVVNIPGFGNVDISKLPPGLIQNVLNGGEVPGIPRETLDKIVKQYMERMYYAAAVAQNKTPVNVDIGPGMMNTEKYLRPLSELPNELVTNVMKGEPLPHLNEEQTQTIKEYYTSQVPTGSDAMNISALISPKMLQMFKLLPKGFNLSEIPPEVIRSVQAGQMPDLTLLPPSLLQHFRDNLDEIMGMMDTGNAPEMSIDELLKKLPKFEPNSNQQTFSPYDINEVDSDLVIAERENAANVRTAHLYAAIVLGLVGAATAIVLATFCYQMAARNRPAVTPEI